MKKFLFLVCTLSFLNMGYARKDKIVFKSLADLEKCAQQHSYDTGVCLEPLQKFVKKNPKQAFEAGQQATRQFAHWVALDFFLARGIDKLDVKTCRDTAFHMAMVSALSLPEDRKERKFAIRVFEKKKCLNDIQPALQKEFANSPNSAFVSAVCPSFKSLAECQKKVETPVAAVTPEKLPEVDKDKIKLNDNVKVYSGPEGEEMAVVQVAGMDLYLIKFSKVKSDWNNKVVLHKEKVNSQDSTDLWTENKGERWVTVASRLGSYTVYLPGQKEMAFSYDKEASAKAKAEKILKDFQKK